MRDERFLDCVTITSLAFADEDRSNAPLRLDFQGRGVSLTLFAGTRAKGFDLARRILGASVIVESTRSGMHKIIDE